MKLRFWLLGVAVALSLPTQAAAFCFLPQPRLVCAEYFASSLVVEATLVQTRELHDKDDPEGISAYLYTMRVNRALRGSAVGNIRVYEGNDSGRAGFKWVQGKEYLLFLSYAATEKSWSLDGCGNSDPLTQASVVLSEIAAIRVAGGSGVIHGAVREASSSDSIAGVHIEAQGTGGRFVATTDEKGEFQMSVPPGRYIVRAAEDGSVFGADPISYEDPRNIRIEPGGCAQVQFHRVRHSSAQ
jgi:Carboxypeptidase regulatory-like domain